jgi:LmeA-like phospholipid-binding
MIGAVSGSGSGYRGPARRSRWPRLVIALVVLVGVLVAADRIALVIAERATGKTVQIAQDLDRAPSVSVAGFPFLTQLVTGHFGKVTLSATDLTVGQEGRTVRISTVRAVLRGVDVARDLSSVRADTATATAAVSYPDLSTTLGVPVSFGGSTPDGVGRVTARKAVSIAGQELSGSVTAEVKIEGESLRFVSPVVTIDGAGSTAVPQPVVDAFSSLFGDPLALSNLPFGLTVRSVTADREGVHITLAGSDVTFDRP